MGNNLIYFKRKETKMNKLLIGLMVASSLLTACSKEEQRQPEENKVIEQAAFVEGSEADFLDFINHKDKIYFNTNEAVMSKEDLMALDMQIAWLEENPEKHVLIEGHCDKRASVSYNTKLGHARARVVAKYMQREGIDATRITTYSKGESEADQNCNSEDCWSTDRMAWTKLNAVKIKINQGE